MNLRPPATLPPTTAAGTYSDLNGLAALKKEPNSPRAIHALAQQVDALFLQMMLKSMRDAASDTGEQQSNEMGIYQDMFDKQVALSLSAHQDLGLGAQLTRQMAALAAMTEPSGTDAQRPVAAPAVAAPAAAAAVSEAGAADFVSQVYPAILRAASALGVSSQAMLAQAALETGWGRRMVRAADGTPSLNLFGIKADDRWAGAKVAADTV